MFSTTTRPNILLHRRRAAALVASIVVVLVGSLLPATAAGAELNEHLAPLKPYVGKTWRGTITDGQSGREATDVARWEAALNGQAVRILHSIDDGEYGGETIVVWDAEREGLVFHYFTTAGFTTQGTISLDEGRFISHETVVGNPDGITEVRATAVLLPDGSMKNSAEYLKSGTWVPGHEITYVEDPEAEVRFR